MTKEIYSAFSDSYDEFMDEIPYSRWARYIHKTLCKHNVQDGLVLDLGCGSGTLTALLSDQGYDMTGVDASSEMLEKAVEKRGDRNILYLQQDIREFELYGTMRAVVCTCDTLNYITDKRELKKVFRLVNNYLDPGGIFIFDVHTEFYYEHELGSRVFADVRDDNAYIWNNYYDRKTCVNSYCLTLFSESSDGTYERSEEVHYERAYDKVYISDALLDAGLNVLAVSDDYTDRSPGEESVRLTFTAQLPEKAKKLTK